MCDRTALILDIFSQRAATKEGKLQVEMAQAEYQLPRLTRYARVSLAPLTNKYGRVPLRLGL